MTEGGNDPWTISRLEELRRREERSRDTRRMQEKRLSVLLSREDALLAKQLSLRDVKLQAEVVREEKRQLHEQLDELRRNRSREMARIIEECQATKRSSREAFRSMVDQKRSRAAEISEESRQLRLKLVKRREEEAREKARLIREIKTVGATRSSDPEPVESSGIVGFLCEISMTELREKVLSAKVRLQREVEQRNTVIRQERERRRNLMRSNQRFLERHRCRESDSHSAVIRFPEIERLNDWSEDARSELKERRMRRGEEQR